jgi:hypothetical protein
LTRRVRARSSTPHCGLEGHLHPRRLPTSSKRSATSTSAVRRHPPISIPTSRGASTAYRRSGFWLMPGSQNHGGCQVAGGTSRPAPPPHL